MATDLKVSVRGQIDRLRKELNVATGQVAALQDEIKSHETGISPAGWTKDGKNAPGEVLLRLDR